METAKVMGWHISPRVGPSECSTDNCPFGKNTPHFETRKEAFAAFQATKEENGKHLRTVRKRNSNASVEKVNNKSEVNNRKALRSQNLPQISDEEKVDMMSPSELKKIATKSSSTRAIIERSVATKSARATQVADSLRRLRGKISDDTVDELASRFYDDAGSAVSLQMIVD